MTTKDAAPAGKGRSLRRDAAANRERILDAAGELLRTDPLQASMPSIARMAGVGTATAYRYFPTLEGLLNSYLLSVVTRLRDYSHDRPTTGARLFDEVASEWLRLLQTYGAAMVQLRSRQGLLERLNAHDRVIVILRDAWERPIRAVLRTEKLADEYFEAALLIYNVLFDPREVLDLRTTGMTDEDIRVRLTAAFKAAVRGWADS